MYFQRIVKSIDLTNLPRNDKQKIDWDSCNNIRVEFIYEGICDNITIIKKAHNKEILIVSYKNNIYEIYINHFIECNLDYIVNPKNYKGKGTKKINISLLPYKHKGDDIVVDWASCKNNIVPFFYNEIIDELTIVKSHGYGYLQISYRDKPLKIQLNNFKKCKFSNLLTQTNPPEYYIVDTGFKYINLNHLPKKSSGLIECIDWNNSIGKSVHFKYGDVRGYFKIISYNSKNREITIKYNNDMHTVPIACVTKCRLGFVVGYYSHDFKYTIGDVVGNFKITDTLYIKHKNNENYKIKGYKYTCLKCGWEDGLITESSLSTAKLCSCCSGRVVIPNINSVAATHPELIKCFVNKEDAYSHTAGSNKRVQAKCPYCGCKYDKKYKVSQIIRGVASCIYCSDYKSYGEKYLISVLTQLKVNFTNQVGSKTIDWIPRQYVYDFFFKYKEKTYIIETHGIQHYEEVVGWNRSLKEQQHIDKIKKNLAQKHIDCYIELDCRHSNSDWIKGSIISKLSNIFNLANVNFKEAELFTLNSLVVEVCDLWNTKTKVLNEIAYLTKLDMSTVIRYLKRGAKLNLCQYETQYDIKRKRIVEIGELYAHGFSVTKIAKELDISEWTVRRCLHKATELEICKYNPNDRIKLKLYKDNNVIGIFNGYSSIIKYSEINFEKPLTRSGLVAVASGKQKITGDGFYVQKLTNEEVKKINKNEIIDYITQLF